MTYRRLYGCPHGALGLCTHTWARAAQALSRRITFLVTETWPGPGPILRRRLLPSSACTKCSARASAWADVCAQGMCEARIPGQDTPDQAQPWLDPESWSWPMRGPIRGQCIRLRSRPGILPPETATGCKFVFSSSHFYHLHSQHIDFLQLLLSMKGVFSINVVKNKILFMHTLGL